MPGFLKSLFRQNYIIPDQDNFIKKVADDVNRYVIDYEIKPNVNMLYIPNYYQIVFPRVFDILMALSFRLRGCEISSVLTGYFHSKECITYGGIYNENRESKIKVYDYIEKKIWVDLLKTDSFHLENFRTDGDIKLAQKYSDNLTMGNYTELFYKDFPVGKNAAIATLNMNNMPELINSKEIINQLKIHANNIIELMNAYERIFDVIKPEVVFSNIPFYYKWGVVCHIAKSRGIPFYSAMMGERKNSYIFSLNSDKILDCSAAWHTFKEKTIDNNTEKVINNLIFERSQGKAAHFSPYPKPYKNSEEFNNLLSRISKGKPVVFFPVNVFFDAIVFQETPAFSNLVDMLKKTIDFFNLNPQYQLIVKAHPAEKLFYQGKEENWKYCLKSILINMQKKLKNNIIFLDYNTSISSYDIIPLINLGIAYTSSTVIEMAWHGKPVISLAECHYQSKGFTYQPQSTEEYFDLINKILTMGEPLSVVNERIELSKKYYYLYFAHAYVDFKMFQGSDTGVVQDKFLLTNYKDLLPGRCEALDYICNSIINKLPIYGDNRWPPMTL